MINVSIRHQPEYLPSPTRRTSGYWHPCGRFQSGISLSICLHLGATAVGVGVMIAFQSGISLSICLHRQVGGLVIATNYTHEFQSGISLSICLHSAPGTALQQVYCKVSIRHQPEYLPSRGSTVEPDQHGERRGVSIRHQPEYLPSLRPALTPETEKPAVSIRHQPEYLPSQRNLLRSRGERLVGFNQASA